MEVLSTDVFHLPQKGKLGLNRNRNRNRKKKKKKKKKKKRYTLLEALDGFSVSGTVSRLVGQSVSHGTSTSGLEE
jgi:hypothetical protein